MRRTNLVFISLMAFVASSGVESCTKPTPRLMPVLPSRSTLHDMMVPNSCSTSAKQVDACADIATDLVLDWYKVLLLYGTLHDMMVSDSCSRSAKQVGASARQADA